MRLSNTWIVVLFVGLGGTLCLPWLKTTWERHPPKTDVVHDWLEAMRKGGDGFQYWSDLPISPKIAFFAVESYEIVDVKFGRHIVRIHSSTQAGTPLVRLYEVMADGDKIYRVTAQGEDRDAATNDLLHRGLRKEDVDRIIRESRF